MVSRSYVKDTFYSFLEIVSSFFKFPFCTWFIEDNEPKALCCLYYCTSTPLAYTIHLGVHHQTKQENLQKARD